MGERKGREVRKSVENDCWLHVKRGRARGGIRDGTRQWMRVAVTAR